MDWTYSQVKKRRCAQCLGPVVLKAFPVEGGKPGEREWRVVCLKGCQPGGHITEGSAEFQMTQAQFDIEKVKQNYPELDDRPKPTKEELDAARKTLFGE